MLLGLKKEGASDTCYNTGKPEHLLPWYQGGQFTEKESGWWVPGADSGARRCLLGRVSNEMVKNFRGRKVATAEQPRECISGPWIVRLEMVTTAGIT